jgi:3-oxoacyl-[acyl-carrier protein] reductase
MTTTLNIREGNVSEEGAVPKRLAGKLAVVTGSSKGIGASIAARFAAEGAAVIVDYASSKADADRVVSEITELGGTALAVQADVTNDADVRRLFAEADRRFGTLDILVNNAGFFEFLPLEQVTVEHFHKQFDLNVLGMILASREALKYFGPSGGSIVNISSVTATWTPPGACVYSATKAAVNALTQSLAKELAPRGIRVNAISPGMVETEGLYAAGIAESEFRTQHEAEVPLRRIGQPEDIAPAAVYLASADSAWVTGETLTIAGGVR